MDTTLETIRAQLQFTERNGKMLEETVVKMIRKCEECQQFHAFVSDTLLRIAAQEYRADLGKCMTSLAESFTHLDKETFETRTLRLESQVLQVLTEIQDWGVVPMKRLLEDCEKIARIESRLKSEFERETHDREKEKKKRMLFDQRRRKEHVKESLTYHLAHFELFRMEKLTKVIQEIARSQAFYHAKGLEIFASPCSQISKLAFKDLRTAQEKDRAP